MSISRVARIAVGSLVFLAVTAGCSDAEDKLASGPVARGDAVSTTTPADVSAIPVDPEFCAALNGSSNEFTGLGVVDPAEIDRVVANFTALRKVAPAPLLADVELVSGTLEEVIPAIAAASSSLPEDGTQIDPENADEIAAQMSALAAQYRAIEDPWFQAALARLSAYSEQKCG